MKFEVTTHKGKRITVEADKYQQSGSHDLVFYNESGKPVAWFADAAHFTVKQ